MISNFLGQAMTQKFQPELKDVTNITRVYGESGMINYPVAPGNTVLLVDPDEHICCLKATDISGRQLPIREFNYQEINLTQNNVVSESVIQNTNDQNTDSNSSNDSFDIFKNQMEVEVKDLKDSINDIRKLLEDFMA